LLAPLDPWGGAPLALDHGYGHHAEPAAAPAYGAAAGYAASAGYARRSDEKKA
jgi:hypothetical protein